MSCLLLMSVVKVQHSQSPVIFIAIRCCCYSVLHSVVKERKRDATDIYLNDPPQAASLWQAQVLENDQSTHCKVRNKYMRKWEQSIRVELQLHSTHNSR